MISNHLENNGSTQTLEALMSYGLGSGANGKIITHVPCANASNRGPGAESCVNTGLMACSQVNIQIKLCSV